MRKSERRKPVKATEVRGRQLRWRWLGRLLLCEFVDASVRNSDANAYVFATLATLATLAPLVTFTVLVTTRATLATLAFRACLPQTYLLL